MTAARAVVERSLEDGAAAYGVTTGVGVRKAFTVDADGHDRLLVDQHLIAQGAAAPHDVVRATTDATTIMIAGRIAGWREEGT